MESLQFIIGIQFRFQFEMYTQQIRRNKGNVFMEMHTLGNSSNLGITKLGSSLVSSMESLQNKKQEILKTTNLSKLPGLFVDFKRQHNNFLDLQKNFFELDQTTPDTQRLKLKIRDFLQNIRVEEVESKLQMMRRDKVKQSQRLQIMQRVEGNKKGPGSQLLMDNQEMIRQKLLQEESQELKVIEKLITDIKSIAIKTSSLIYEQGVNLNIAAQTIKSAKHKFKDGRGELVEANKYQQDTGRSKLFLCLLVIILVAIVLLVILAANRN